MTFAIYTITNRLDLSKIYVGQTKQNPPEKRWKAHVDFAKSGKGFHRHSAMRKYGIENFVFEVREIVATEQEADETERFYIDFFGLNERHGYNVCSGGAKGARIAGATGRVMRGLDPERDAAISSKNGEGVTTAHAKRTSEERSAIIRKGHITRGAEGRSAATRKAARKRVANMGPERRSEAARKGNVTRGSEGRKAAAHKRLETTGPERLSEAVRKANAMRGPEGRSEATRKGHVIRRRKAFLRAVSEHYGIDVSAIDVKDDDLFALIESETLSKIMGE